MMGTQHSGVGFSALDETEEALHHGQVRPLGSTGGDLEVLDGRVWLTLGAGDGDHVLGRGERFRIPASGLAIVEAWGRRGTARIAWRPLGGMERLRALLQAAFARPDRLGSLPHNGGDASVARRSLADGRKSRDGSGGLAQEARRCPTGAA